VQENPKTPFASCVIDEFVRFWTHFQQQQFWNAADTLSSRLVQQEFPSTSTGKYLDTLLSTQLTLAQQGQYRQKLPLNFLDLLVMQSLRWRCFWHHVKIKYKERVESSIW
jgi:hypothetical protein